MWNAPGCVHVQERLVAAGLLKGRTVAIDATTLEANAAMRAPGAATPENYQEFLTRLATASGRQDADTGGVGAIGLAAKEADVDKDWENPADPDAKITKMKDGRTHPLTKQSTPSIWTRAHWSRSRCRAPTWETPPV